MLHDTVQNVGLELLLLSSGGALRGGLVNVKTHLEPSFTKPTSATVWASVPGNYRIISGYVLHPAAARDSMEMDVSPHLQQHVDDGRLLAGWGHAQVVHDQHSHEVKDVLLGWVVGQGRLGAHVTVFRLAAVHTRVPSKGLELFNGRTCFIIQITDLEWTKEGSKIPA